MSKTNTVNFDRLKLNEPLLHAIAAAGFETPTPIQAAAIPELLAGKSIIGKARTGSGKTAAFGIPALHMMREGGGQVRCLILAPTRELAIQVSDSLKNLAPKKGKLKILPIYGGAPYPPQLKALKAGVDIVVGTPGRVIDHMERGSLDVSGVEFFVLDEADEMLRMGFIDEVERIFENMPDENQVALFSATMPKPIKRIVKRKIPDHVVVQVEESALTTEHIRQRYTVAPYRHRMDALMRILQTELLGTTLIFANTRRDCAEVAELLVRKGFRAHPLHGDMEQPARERVLARLKSGDLQLLVATDVAARGIDVVHINHVINLELPGKTESYVHRIGRTARAGREGTAITLVEPNDQRRLRYLQKDLGVEFEKMEVPSDRDIAMVQRQALWDDLVQKMGSPEFDDAEKWLFAMLKNQELDESDLAAAAIAMLAEQRDMRLHKKPDSKPPAWTKQRPQHDKSRPSQRKGRGPRKRFNRRKPRGPRRD